MHDNVKNNVRKVDALSGNLIIGGYLPWHGTPEFDGEWSRWNDEGHDPEKQDIFSVFWPEKGSYSSQDDSVLRMQAEEIKKAGIDIVVIFWNDCYRHEKQRVESIMKTFGEVGLKGFIGVDFNWNIMTGEEDQLKDMVDRLEQVIRFYAPASEELYNNFYYKDPISGLPVFMIYTTIGDIAFWDEKVREYKSSDQTNGVFICGITSLDMTFSNAFDGISWTGTPQMKSDRAEHELHLNNLAQVSEMFYMGGLVAGFDFMGREGTVNLERDCGWIFHEKWSGLIQAEGVNSSKVQHIYEPFNDWGEGGSIEPAADYPPVRKDGVPFKTFAPLHSTDYLSMNYARAKEFKKSR